jgi:AcrR family transcriptional regulator
MRRKTDPTRQQIIDAAFEMFWRSGFRRTSMDRIADRADLTKRTVYAYFRSKDDLLAAVLAQYGQLATKRLRQIGDQIPVELDGMIEAFFNQLARWATSTPRWAGSGFTKLVVELADLPGHPARAIARRHKVTTEAWLVERLLKAQVAHSKERARELMLLMEGSMILMLIHRDRAYIDAAMHAAKRLIKGKARSHAEVHVSGGSILRRP